MIASDGATKQCHNFNWLLMVRLLPPDRVRNRNDIFLDFLQDHHFSFSYFFSRAVPGDSANRYFFFTNLPWIKETSCLWASCSPILARKADCENDSYTIFHPPQRSTPPTCYVSTLFPLPLHTVTKFLLRSLFVDTQVQLLYIYLKSDERSS